MLTLVSLERQNSTCSFPPSLEIKWFQAEVAIPMATYPVVASDTLVQGRFRCYVNGITVFFLIITDGKDVNITDVFLIDHLE